jgi:hypothetical protein
MHPLHLRRPLAELLDDGTGRIRPELSPLAEHLLAMNNPLTGLTWLYPARAASAPPTCCVPSAAGRSS